MKKILLVAFCLTSLKLYSQNKLVIIASPDGDGFTTQTATVTAEANKFKLNNAAVLKSFQLQCPGYQSGHKLVISVAGASLAAGFLNTVSDNAVHAFKFDQDVSDKQVTVTDVPATGSSTTYLTFVFTKGTTAIVTTTPPQPSATPTVITIKYINQSGIDSPPSKFPDPSSKKITIAKNVTAIKGFMISADNLAAGHKLIITQAVGSQTDTYSPGDGIKVENWINLLNGTIIIKEDKGDGSAPVDVASVLFDKPADPNVTQTSTDGALISPQDAITLSNYRHNTYGYVDKKDPSTVHLFFDMYGNNLFETIPPGVPNLNYVVHIVYPGYSDQADDITYSVKQNSGTPDNGTLMFKNTNILSLLSSSFQSKTIGTDNNTKHYDMWRIKTLYLGNAHEDIAFTITTSVKGDDGKASPPTDLVSYTIKMSTVYHGSFDVGLINSSLRNPTYTLTAAPDGSANQVVKTANDGSRGMVSVMVSLYTSPVILLESLFKKVPSFDLTGRDFVDDHKIYERLYPTVGVSVNETAFDNLFYGLNWEIARGLSVFGGRHWGKINNLPIPGYVPGQTVTQAQFNYYTNTRWSTAWAYGIKLDILIITNLIGAKKTN